MGYAVPRGDFDAEVHSIFAAAVNLQLVRGNRLLTLVSFQEADLPQGIRLNTPEGFSFEGLHRGERVACLDGMLCCEVANLIVDLQQARRWKCDLPALAAKMNDRSTVIARRFVAQVLNDQWALDGARLPGGQSAAACRMDKITPDLVAATHRYDHLAAADSIAGLVGLGTGLTPAGDDFLIGFLAGLWSSAGERTERLRFLSSLGKVVTRLSRRTNDISRTYLIHAARGQVSSRLSALAEAMSQGACSDHLRETAEASIQVGHISGLEATKGLLMGLSAWNGEHIMCSAQ